MSSILPEGVSLAAREKGYSVADKSRGFFFNVEPIEIVDFFDIEGLSKTVNTVLSDPKKYDQLRKKARETILKNYDLDTICLPNQLKLVESLIK